MPLVARRLGREDRADAVDDAEVGHQRRAAEAVLAVGVRHEVDRPAARLRRDATTRLDRGEHRDHACPCCRPRRARRARRPRRGRPRGRATSPSGTRVDRVVVGVEEDARARRRRPRARRARAASCGPRRRSARPSCPSSRRRCGHPQVGGGRPRRRRCGCATISRQQLLAALRGRRRAGGPAGRWSCGSVSFPCRVVGRAVVGCSRRLMPPSTGSEAPVIQRAAGRGEEGDDVGDVVGRRRCGRAASGR